MDSGARARVLIAVDGSERARHVLEEGMREASARGGEAVVLRVVGLPPELPAEALALRPDALLDSLVEAARKATEDLARDYAPVPVRIEIGSAVPVILRVAESENFSLVVMGAHGYRFGERLLGTTVARLVNQASVSVLVVR